MIATYFKGSTPTFKITVPITSENPHSLITSLVFSFFQCGIDGQPDIQIDKELEECDIEYIYIEDTTLVVRINVSVKLTQEEMFNFNTDNIITYQLKYMNTLTDSIYISPMYKFYVREPINKSELAPHGPEVKTVVWENASPRSDFNYQSLELDLSTYEAVEILCSVIAGSINQISVRSLVEDEEEISTLIEGLVAYRIATVDEDSITFSDAYRDEVMNNSYIIPTKIYGIVRE